MIEVLEKQEAYRVGEMPVTLERIYRVVSEGKRLELSSAAIERIQQCRAYLDDKIYKDEAALYYGINTGFGYLQQVRIDRNEIQQLQYNLLQSHACGVGEKVPKELVRLMLLTKIESLSRGHSGVQLETVQRLVDFYNHDVLPVVYNQGSLGASGDLSPLSHLSLPLIGMGEVYFEGKVCPSAQVLEQFGKNIMNPSYGPWRIGSHMMGETIPKESNYVALDTAQKDEWDMPQLKVNVDYDQNDLDMIKDYREQLAEMFDAAGFKNIRTWDDERRPGLDIHEMGGVRMGHDPKTSLLNKHHQLHACPNVYVTDGACMTSTSTQNPSLTYMVFAARAVDHALKKDRKSVV